MAQILDHPNIVRVYEHAFEENQAYIVMEYVAGRPLNEFTRFDRLLPAHRVVGIIFQCCLALDYAFKQGIVHRDIKPANILVDDQDNVKIMDFGLALDLNRQGNEDSTFIMGVGSPSYMSPEQIKGHPLNQKTDLYSLGVVLFELLTGRLPFRAANRAQLVYKIINADPPQVSSLNPEVPETMNKVLQKALEKDLYSRYKNGADMAQDLAAVRFQIFDDSYVPMDSSRFDILRKLAFFRAFDDIEIWETLRISSWREYPADTVLLKEGKEDKDFGILIKGEIELSRAEKFIALLGKGECIGETSYLSNAIPFRIVTATTVTPVVYLEVNPSALALASDECQESFRKALIGSVLRRLVATLDQVAQNSRPAHQGKHAAKFELELMEEAQRRG